MGNVQFDIGGLLELQRQLAQFTPEKIDRFMTECTRDLAKLLLRKVRKRTPIGKYDKPVSFVTRDGKQVSFTPHTGKKGGTLRNSWTVSGIEKRGKNYTITLTNTARSDKGIPYAGYVETGHQTADRSGWVMGRFMLKESEDELRQIMDRIINKKLNEFLRGGE